MAGGPGHGQRRWMPVGPVGGRGDIVEHVLRRTRDHDLVVDLGGQVPGQRQQAGGSGRAQHGHAEHPGLAQGHGRRLRGWRPAVGRDVFSVGGGVGAGGLDARVSHRGLCGGGSLAGAHRRLRFTRRLADPPSPTRSPCAQREPRHHARPMVLASRPARSAHPAAAERAHQRYRGGGAQAGYGWLRAGPAARCGRRRSRSGSRPRPRRSGCARCAARGARRPARCPVLRLLAQPAGVGRLSSTSRKATSTVCR